MKLFDAAAMLAGFSALLVASGCCVGPGPRPLTISPASAPAGPALAPDKKVDLTVLVYNIWGLPSWMNHASSARYARIACELERLQPDLVLLQEAWTKAAETAVPTNGGWAVARAPAASFFRRNGLLVMSRYPIIGGEFRPFTSAAFPDSIVRKGALKVTVLLPGGQHLNVWNVHLQAGNATRVRSRQIAELASWVRAAEDGQVADLVAGDFNSTPDSPQFQQLSHELGRTAQEIAHQEYFPTYDDLSPNPKAAETLDYLFIRPRIDLSDLEAAPGVRFATADRRQRLSDHLALEVALRLGAAPALITTAGVKEVARSHTTAATRATEPLGY
jgi:endonuclease/exonuclease/phosphatase family metal-dependent hydrolase